MSKPLKPTAPERPERTKATDIARAYLERPAQHSPQDLILARSLLYYAAMHPEQAAPVRSDQVERSIELLHVLKEAYPLLGQVPAYIATLEQKPVAAVPVRSAEARELRKAAQETWLLLIQEGHLSTDAERIRSRLRAALDQIQGA